MSLSPNAHRSSPTHWEGAVDVNDCYSPVSSQGVKLKIHQPKTSKIQIGDEEEVDPDVAALIKTGRFVDNVVEQSDTEFLDAEKKTYRRRVKTQVEVPVTRKVKVATVTDEAVEETIMVKVKCIEQKSVPSTKMVEEEYVDYEEVTEYEIQEVWVKKLVAQAVVKKIEVKKVRDVTVPCTVIKDYEVEKEVPVKRKVIKQVPGFRIDEITDTRMVEMEGWQEVELVPQIKEMSKLMVDKSHSIGGPQGKHLERRMGGAISTTDKRLANVDTDSSEDEVDTIILQGDVKLDGTEHRVKHVLDGTGHRVKQIRY
eukprot:NODE_486_length_1641_cov_12.131281_g346_i0.p1 GENE.NODE_486_length_1641_cov_12.131281_g346_i0~~NODE_486_length_1641_cov_12.131281_g346_i0.p1  ORF type:complete len:312 (+),score=92.66 NODE_486_length_1641_cov_12.131281_g346_i0:39-974(+)